MVSNKLQMTLGSHFTRKPLQLILPQHASKGQPWCTARKHLLQKNPVPPVGSVTIVFSVVILFLSDIWFLISSKPSNPSHK